MKSKTTIIALAGFFILASCTGKSKKINETALWDEKPQQTQTVTAKAETPETQVAETVVEPTVETKAEKVTPTAEKPIEQKTTQQDDNKIYEKPDVKADLPLDEKGITEIFMKNFKYPETLKDNPINARSTAYLTIEKDGSISDIELIPSIHPDMDKEFIRVYKLFPKCTPAKVNGKPVRSKISLRAIAVAK